MLEFGWVDKQNLRTELEDNFSAFFFLEKKAFMSISVQSGDLIKAIKYDSWFHWIGAFYGEEKGGGGWLMDHWN